MTAPLALPPGTRAARSAGPARPRNLLNIGVLAVAGGGLALFTTLAAAYVSVGHASRTWPPNGFSFDVYIGIMLALTVLMSAITAEWAHYAVKRDDTAQGVWGLLLTAGFGVSFVLLLWQLGTKIGFGPGDAKFGAFAVIVFAMIVTSGALAIMGIVAVVLALARVLGHQMTPSNNEMVRAVAWFWDFVVVAWLIVFSALWLFT